MWRSVRYGGKGEEKKRKEIEVTRKPLGAEFGESLRWTLSQFGEGVGNEEKYRCGLVARFFIHTSSILYALK